MRIELETFVAAGAIAYSTWALISAARTGKIGTTVQDSGDISKSKGRFYYGVFADTCLLIAGIVILYASLTGQLPQQFQHPMDIPL